MQNKSDNIANLRKIISKEIANILKEENEPIDSQEEPTTDNRVESINKATSIYTRNIQNSVQSISPEELTDALMNIMDTFQYTRSMKTNVLIGVKNKLQV